MSDGAAVALIGLAGGVLLGLAARLGRFCTLGAIEDMRLAGQSGRLRMWVVAMGVAAAGVGALTLAGLFDPAQSFYLSTPFNPATSVAGGLMFGYGMALAGNCGFGALARAGGGDLRSMVIVLVMGLTAYVTLSGALAPLRVALFEATALPARTRGLDHAIAGATGLPEGLTGLVAGTAAVLLALAARRGVIAPAQAGWGAVVGAAILLGWAGTYHVAQAGFDAVPVVSHTFTAPLGETMLYAMTSSGGGLSFAVGSVAGVLAGAAAGSLVRGHFRWEACEDPAELRRQLLGAALMGVGGVLAMGCTIGQGISAMSVLAYSAPLVFGGIYAGAALGLRHLVEGWQGHPG